MGGRANENAELLSVCVFAIWRTVVAAELSRNPTPSGLFLFQILSAAEATASIVVAAIPVTTKFFTAFIPGVFKSCKERSSQRRFPGKEDEIPLSSLDPGPSSQRQETAGSAGQPGTAGSSFRALPTPDILSRTSIAWSEIYNR